MKTRLMRFNSHNYFYRSTKEEVFRIIREGRNEPPYNVYTMYDGNGDMVTCRAYSLTMAMEICEDVTRVGQGDKNEN